MFYMQEDIQCVRSDTAPPMLDRTDFESWQQRIRLYCLGKDNGENIMKSIKEGPFQMGTVSDVITGGTEGAVQQGPVRARVLNDLSAEEKERYKADIRATNILLQGIPKDIYSLINHYTDAKDIWENVKMILEGSELTKDDRDQLNSKFVKTMLPEWSKFKLKSNLTSLKSQTVISLSDASVQQYPTQSSKSKEPSPADNFQLDSGSSSTENLIESLSNTLALLTQSERCVQRMSVEDTMPKSSRKTHFRQTSKRNWCSRGSRRTEQRGMIKSWRVEQYWMKNSRIVSLQRNRLPNVDDDVDDSTENDLALNVDHIFEADECDTFDSDVDEGLETDITQKDEKRSQNDKTEHGMEKTVKDKAKSKPKNQSSQKVNRKVNWSKSKSTPTWSSQKKVKEKK
ncbi:hypothetical protein Tco_1080617 [Tanacetum coccineum]|uniref:Integrase, catalytic region, zinc finger, CCHC-type, peptidase aspartic, catalytic n=1 Tax=Tanacetum coccineum TaxID=301880 RepID=A0ABQ5HV76_9ASTR